MAVVYSPLDNVSHVYTLSVLWLESQKDQRLKLNFFFFYLKKNFFFQRLFIFGTERQSMSWGGAEREGDTESETGSRL